MMKFGARQIRRLGARERGVALFISLVMLLVLTIIGVSAVQTTSLETRMARNEHDVLLAFQAAESALRDAEVFLEGVTSLAPFTDAGTDGLWTVADFGDPARWEQPNVWVDATSEVVPTAVGVVADQPRYMIEHLATVLRDENAYEQTSPYAGGAADRIEVFRVTARGVGGTANAQVLLQTTYGRILD